MTTARKLWLGFGTLTPLLVLSSVAIILRVRAIEGKVGEIQNAHNLIAETRELEINFLDYALGVSAYLQSGDPQPRQEAANEAADVERHLKEYQRLATTTPQRKMAADFAISWQELTKLGQALLHAENRQLKPEESKRFYDLRTGLENLLDDEIQVEAVETFNACRDAALRDVQSIVGFALILLIVGAVIAVVTSGAVGRGVVKGERQLWASRERFRVTLASIGDAVITTDSEGRITFLNSVADSLTGWKQTDAAGQPLDVVFRIDDSAAPIQDEQGKVAGVVLIFRDITARKEADDMMPPGKESTIAWLFSQAPAQESRKMWTTGYNPPGFKTTCWLP